MFPLLNESHRLTRVYALNYHNLTGLIFFLLLFARIYYVAISCSENLLKRLERRRTAEQQFLRIRRDVDIIDITNDAIQPNRT